LNAKAHSTIPIECSIVNGVTRTIVAGERFTSWESLCEYQSGCNEPTRRLELASRHKQLLVLTLGGAVKRPQDKEKEDYAIPHKR
jgi:hypothetical protein